MPKAEYLFNHSNLDYKNPLSYLLIYLTLNYIKITLTKPSNQILSHEKLQYLNTFTDISLYVLKSFNVYQMRRNEQQNFLFTLKVLLEIFVLYKFMF